MAHFSSRTKEYHWPPTSLAWLFGTVATFGDLTREPEQMMALIVSKRLSLPRPMVHSVAPLRFAQWRLADGLSCAEEQAKLACLIWAGFQSQLNKAGCIPADTEHL